MLAPYAVRVEHSRGRRHPEPRHPYRDDFQRDRDRVIHSRAFRRLEKKTQVFTDRYSDHFRSRLTHTMEVAQISRTIAAALGLNGELVETLALVHDIGHPPFGHSGEKALDTAMQRHGERFDHNLHALRIVEHFEQRYADFPGLNLTFEVREGIIKHSRDWSAAEHPQLAEYLLDQRPPLEAQLIDQTDEIAYCTADLDDGLEAGILTIEQIRAAVPLFADCWNEAARRSPAASEKLVFNEALRRMLDRLVSALIANTANMVKGIGAARVDDVRRHPVRVAALDEATEQARLEAKQFLYRNLYFSEPLMPEKMRAEMVVAELFDLWINEPSELPAGYAERIRAGDVPAARVVCDYIAGMTDNFCLQQHCKFFPQRRASPSP